MAMNDKELKKIKAMMPSGATLAGLKNIIKGQRERAKKNKSDRHPGTGAKATVKSMLSKLKSTYPVSNKDVAFLKKSMPKRKKKTKTGPGSR